MFQALQLAVCAVLPRGVSQATVGDGCLLLLRVFKSALFTSVFLVLDFVEDVEALQLGLFVNLFAAYFYFLLVASSDFLPELQSVGVLDGRPLEFGVEVGEYVIILAVVFYRQTVAFGSLGSRGGGTT